MNNTEIESKISELCKDEGFIEKLAAADSADAFAALIRNAGIEITAEEADKVYSSLKNAENGELPDDALDEISGGMACFDRNSATDIETASVLSKYFSKAFLVRKKKAHDALIKHYI